MPEGVDLPSLAEAVRKLLREHVDALEPAPVMDAEPARRLVERLEADLDGPLLKSLRTLAPPGVDGAVDTRELPEVLAELEAARRGNPETRRRLAAAVTLKRRTEASGLLFSIHQKLLALERAPPETPSAIAEAAVQWAGLHERLRAAADGLTDALDRWAGSVADAGKGSVDVGAALRRARDLLRAGSERAARLELVRALEAELAAKAWGRAEAGRLDDALAAWTVSGARLPSPADALRRLHSELLREQADRVESWRLMDAVEAVVNRADMTPWPDMAEGANGNP